MSSAEDEIIGRGWSFAPTFSKHNHSVQMVGGIEDIEQSLDILFNTIPGERIMLEKYGCDMKAFVFNPLNTTTKTKMKSQIEMAILNYEPRILVNSVDLDDSGYLDGVILITISFTISQTNSRHNVVYPFYFLEGTNIG